MAFALKDSPVLPAAESKRLVESVIKTSLSEKRREELKQYAQCAKTAYSKPIKG